MFFFAENAGAFTIKPEKKLLCPNDRNKIECYFTPPFLDQLFAAQIYGKALIYPPLSVEPVPKDETNCILVPFSMRFMGKIIISFKFETFFNLYVNQEYNKNN